MNLTPWKSSTSAPFTQTRVGEELASFQREMNNIMNNFLNRSETNSPINFDMNFYPAIDLVEKDNKYLLDADFHNNTLTIKGQKKSEKETREMDFVCVERSTGSFRRDIYLDDEIDQDNIKADLKDGVLHVELIKKEKGRTNHKKVTIRH